MKAFQKRARAEEAVFAVRNATEFNVWAGGLRRLGEWAASEMMGEGAPAIRDYADALVRSGVAGSDAFSNVHNDLTDAGVELADGELRSRFDDFLAEARQRNG